MDLCYTSMTRGSLDRNLVQVEEFSAANLALAGFPLTNALGENLPPRH